MLHKEGGRGRTAIFFFFPPSVSFLRTAEYFFFQLGSQLERKRERKRHPNLLHLLIDFSLSSIIALAMRARAKGGKTLR
ncbi:MAG: hypothetical protein J3Q66DRAFT_338253 [Benniella sp.]|nr:MAG: hypothetical protein J3Q66DRAFT_338253 [Benniella sp.]